MSELPEPIELTPDRPRYPVAVSSAFGRKAPHLWALGNVDLLGEDGIGFCGSRKASSKGLETAHDCADQAAVAGFNVVSGNAAGIDFTAHFAALKAGGSTTLVLPEGIDHFRIRKDLQSVWDWRRVLVISQFERSASWQSYRAMERNALIIALSQAMIVIEAGPTGGTLNAGLTTLSSGKPLFVAVYERMDENAQGNALLIGKGGIPLAKSRSTGRANMDKVRNSLITNQSAHVPYAKQAALF